jgi:hypothetical protein
MRDINVVSSAAAKWRATVEPHMVGGGGVPPLAVFYLFPDDK